MHCVVVSCCSGSSKELKRLQKENWGFVFFAEIKDFWTVFGSCVIAGAGLYVWRRETDKKVKALNDD